MAAVLTLGGPGGTPAADIDANAYVHKNVCMAETVRIDPASHAALTAIARAKRIPLTEALGQAVERYRREVFLEALARDFAALKADAGAWKQEQAERKRWDSTDSDGLADE
jgi:hypothetical protein